MRRDYQILQRVQAVALMVFFFNGIAGIWIFGALRVSMDGFFLFLFAVAGLLQIILITTT